MSEDKITPVDIRWHEQGNVRLPCVDSISPVDRLPVSFLIAQIRDEQYQQLLKDIRQIVREELNA